MGKTLIEKIISDHAGKDVSPGDIVDITIDVRAARDFGGANVVKNIRENALPIDDPDKTIFTFDCNPGGSDQKYATNQQICRDFARNEGIGVYDIDAGIGTHLAMDQGLAVPGSTFVSTDSHANILGAIGAFGQGMGDVDIAQAFGFGKVWFKVPPTVKVVLKGTPAPEATAKDLVLAMLRAFGANGLLGFRRRDIRRRGRRSRSRGTDHHRVHGDRDGGHHRPLPAEPGSPRLLLPSVQDGPWTGCSPTTTPPTRKPSRSTSTAWRP